MAEAIKLRQAHFLSQSHFSTKQCHVYSFCKSKSWIKNEMVLVFIARYLYLSKKKKKGWLYCDRSFSLSLLRKSFVLIALIRNRRIRHGI